MYKNIVAGIVQQDEKFTELAEILVGQYQICVPFHNLCITSEKLPGTGTDADLDLYSVFWKKEPAVTLSNSS